MTFGLAFTHVNSMRLASGEEVLVARVQTREGRTGFGFSMRLDATEARHMAEWHAGARSEPPRVERVLGHAWELAFLNGESIPWHKEPAFARLQWLCA